MLCRPPCTHDPLECWTLRPFCSFDPRLCALQSSVIYAPFDCVGCVLRSLSTMIYDVTSALFRSFLAVSGSSHAGVAK